MEETAPRFRARKFLHSLGRKPSPNICIAGALRTSKRKLPDYEQPQVGFRHAELRQRDLGFGNNLVELTSRIHNHWR